MDNLPEGVTAADITALSYDNDVAYENQVHSEDPNDLGHGSLANRIGNAKLYLLSETTSSTAKRKRDDDGEVSNRIDEDMQTDEDDSSRRSNALLFRGSPISHLPTAGLFAYATHFDARPMGLEWIDDKTCVLVFDSKAAARIAARRLQKSSDEVEDEEGFLTAKPIPVALWPPEERINKSLGKGEGLKGVIRMRWAMASDVKKKGARRESEFYKKHGETTGKDGSSAAGQVASKRRKTEGDEEVKLQLDNDLDAFLAEEEKEPSPPPSPPSKMRSDYIGKDGRTLIERTSFIRAHPDVLAERITAPLPRRRNRGHRGDGHAEDVPQDRWTHDFTDADRDHSRRGQRRRGESKRTDRPKKTQQELDDELEAFLHDRQ